MKFIHLYETSSCAIDVASQTFILHNCCDSIQLVPDGSSQFAHTDHAWRRHRCTKWISGLQINSVDSKRPSHFEINDFLTWLSINVPICVGGEWTSESRASARNLSHDTQWKTVGSMQDEGAHRKTSLLRVFGIDKPPMLEHLERTGIQAAVARERAAMVCVWVFGRWCVEFSILFKSISIIKLQFHFCSWPVFPLSIFNFSSFAFFSRKIMRSLFCH